MCVHRWSSTPILFSAFVAMQPISRALGPTRFVPFTHTDAEAHAALESHGDVIGLARVPTGERPWRQPGSTDGSLPPRSYVALLQTGDVAVYDGRTFHSGGANTMSLDGGGGVNTMGLDGGGGVNTMGLVGDRPRPTSCGSSSTPRFVTRAGWRTLRHTTIRLTAPSLQSMQGSTRLETS